MWIGPQAIPLAAFVKGNIMARLSGKLTARTLGWDRIAIGAETKKVPADGGRVLLGRFAGIVSGLKQTVNNDTGEVQNGLKGQFRGLSTRNEKGESVDVGKGLIVTAGVCYLPGGIQDKRTNAKPGPCYAARTGFRLGPSSEG